MPSQSRTPSMQNEKPEIVASKEELTVLEKLSQGLSATISNLSRQRPTFDGGGTALEISINESRYSTLKGHRELARHCYGRTVVGEEVNEEGRALSPFVYRITQANVGVLDGGCNILARNSPIASKLVTADPGEEIEVNVPKGVRYLTVQEVRTFDGPTNLLSLTQKPNFRTMVLTLLARANSIAVQNLRAFVDSLSRGASEEVRSEGGLSQELDGRSVGALENEPTWLERWQGVNLGSSETSSLSHQFFTRTTSKQENALNNPRGLTFVEGIAGSGKTSIALGRLKFFANFGTGEERSHYGLGSAGAHDFSPTNMVGFVLSHSLKRYLKETAAELGLEELPIRDFQEFRSDLSNRFGLTKKFKRSQSQVSSCRTKLAWLFALDVAVARAAGRGLREFIGQNVEVPSSVKKVVLSVADEMASAQIDADQSSFKLRGLADRLIDAAMTAEFRAREVSVQERISRETERNIRYELRNELERIAKEEERHAVSSLGRSLLGLINVGDLVDAVAKSNDLEDLARKSFENQADFSVRDVDDAVVAFKSELSSESGKLHAVTDTDLVAIIILSAMVAEGFDRLDAPPQLYQIRRNTAAFIDEVQDFREIEVLLMGMVVTDAYNQITLAGDRRQQLQSMGASDLRNLFPYVPRSLRNRSVFLDRNFRQRRDLRILSSGIRSVLREDETLDESEKSAAVVHTFKTDATMAKLILGRLITVDPYATIALILPSELEARRWYDLLREELAAYHRPALLSHRDDLTRRNDIHFTEVREAKGLEFDVVVLPDIASFDLASVVGRNQLYVAVSRPRHAVLLGCNQQSVGGEALQKLEMHEIISMTSVREFSVN